MMPDWLFVLLAVLMIIGGIYNGIRGRRY